GGLAGLLGRVRVDQGLLQLGATLCVTLDDDLSLLIASDLALLSHGSTLLAEFDVLADDRVELLQHEAVRCVAAVLARHVGVSRAGSRTQLDDRTDVLSLLGHQSFTPFAIRSFTTFSMPRASITLMPLADTFRVTLRPSDAT